MIRLDYQPWGETLAELRDAARRAEDAGAAVVWAPELHRNALITATAMAAATNTIGVGTGVALAFARSPMLTALAALDLDELSGGRFRLGLGSGVRRLIETWHGAGFDPPVARLRDTVAAIRAIIARAHLGEPILHTGHTSVEVRGWRRPYAPVRDSVPIYLAAVGPAMTALAGEIADGWLSHELCPPPVLTETILPALRRGAARRPTESGRLPEIVVSACCSVGSDAAAARHAARGAVGFYAGVKTYAELFAGAGFAAEHQAAVDALRAGRPADRLADCVPPKMAAAFTLSGTRDDVAEGLARYHGLADAVKLSPPVHGLAPHETRAAQNAIIDLIRELA
ncbi:LLM class flavin-dependent oxidoreductase [Hamadaea sp. NPDC051192]|uniref:LLM class flavin-dependent oxidoreductase n=1 Tax=Hamadaea sp. NPDC051192 TaxID=3154940 RepID=UPI003421EEE6